ncbi:hypothetical protein COUCH_31710 [Couchioplanes caeruleus]|uniref:hypothetical protein n=1 Tax=Couchioplanes caeruleus TaxID=56438 RepID=UPI0020C17A0F|nr:hypothetical protein [Couchioplanes caeruleus]UQU63535.1 hypothetical protein COUCH_31710 [Couchioplanes caeruleus]
MTQPRHPAAEHTRKRSPLPWVLLAVFLVALGVVLVPKLIGGGDESPAPVAASEADPLLTAADKCDPAKEGLKLSDKNRKLTVNGAGDKFPVGLSDAAMTCVFDTLGVPGALSSRMTSTVGADGQLEGEWPGYTVVWTNDSAKGLDLVVTRDES